MTAINIYDLTIIMDTVKINVMDMVLSFTAAMDSVSYELKNHQKRVTNIAIDIAYEMGLPEREIFDIMIAAKLHDIGAISILERNLLTSLSFDTNYAHAGIGYAILKDFKLFEKQANMILHHHRAWKYGANRLDSNGSEVPMGSWIIHLADRIDIAMDHSDYALNQKNRVSDKLSKHFGKIFHPDVVDAYMSLAEKEYFWLDVNFSDASVKYRDMFAKYSEVIEGNAIVDLSKSFSHIIDFRDIFTSTHSIGVSTSAMALTRLAGFDESMQQKMRVAGFLHDLGKIVIPIAILEKNGPLTDQERLIINSHTYHTYNILSSVSGLEDINRWASYHHEKLDGSGYPFHLKADKLDTMSRIMMLADILTALREDRPYRKGMGRMQVEGLISDWVRGGKLDKDLAVLLFSNYEEIDGERRQAQETAFKCYECALSGKAAPQ